MNHFARLRSRRIETGIIVLPLLEMSQIKLAHRGVVPALPGPRTNDIAERAVFIEQIVVLQVRGLCTAVRFYVIMMSI